MIEEIFKDVIGYEGLYQVSNLGNVKSLERIAIRPKSGNYIVKEKILKPGKDGNGYYLVILSKDCKRKTIKIHVLVAMAFLGHVPDGTTKIVPDHKNDIITDNRASNLELITHRQNIQKAYLSRKTSSKYTGVSWSKQNKKWRAQIKINDKVKNLGYFTDEYQAHLAYQKALKQLNQ